ncbi:MAG: DUF3253 domain-containing protein [Lacipirellulaceae bacterium]
MDQSTAETFSDEQIAEEILRLVNLRGPKKSICPSEAARHLGGGDYRDIMQQVRDVAAELITKGELRATQKGETVDPDTARGPIRLALPETDEA